MENQELHDDISTQELKLKQSWKPFWGSIMLFGAIILVIFGAFMCFISGEEWLQTLFIYSFSVLSLYLFIFLCFILPKLICPKEFTFTISDRLSIKKNSKTILDLPKEDVDYSFGGFSVWGIGGESLILKWKEGQAPNARKRKKIIGLLHFKTSQILSLQSFLRCYL